MAGTSSQAAWCRVLEHNKQYPSDFEDIEKHIPHILLDIRYATKNNFTGSPLSGYWQPRALLRSAPLKALCKAQLSLEKLGYTLLIFDAYRPQSAVNDMIEWVNKNAPEYQELNYVSPRSNHSRGIAIDLTLAEYPPGSCTATAFDMGTDFDEFTEQAHTDSPLISKTQKQNRQLLVSTMQKYGFTNYHKEWWHFTYTAGNYPEIFYNFPIR